MATIRPGHFGHRLASAARGARCRGSAVAYFLVILGLISTSLVTTMSLASVSGLQIANLDTHRDAAFYAAEGGLQRAIWELNNNNWAGRSYPTLGGTLGSAFYSVHGTIQGSNVLITATGASGTSPYSMITVSAVLKPSGTVPSVSVGGNINANNGKGGGRLDITGNIYFYGQSLNRNVSNFNIHADANGNGDFDYLNSVVNNNNQLSKLDFDTGHTYHLVSSLPPKPDVNSMVNTLRNNGCTTLGNRPSVIDLNAAVNHTVYIPSDEQITSSTSIIGDGIIIVQNSVQISDGGALDGHKICIISQQDISFDPGNHTTFSAGSALGLYANTQVSIQSTCEISGVVSAGQDFNSSGKIIIDYDPSIIPLVDPRLTGGGGSMKVSSFTGPLQ